MTPADHLSALLRARFSCRAFTEEAVDPAEIEAALRDAQNVASWGNTQPWQVYASGQEDTRALAAALFEHTKSAPHQSDIPFPTGFPDKQRERRRTCGWQLYGALGIQKGDREASGRQMRENFRLFGGQAFVLITTPKVLGAYGVLDCGGFLTGFLLALEARGLGSVAMAAVAGFSPFMRAWYEVPEEEDVLCGVTIGHKDMTHPANSFRTERAGLAEVVRWR
jgi:nitroreductase